MASGPSGADAPDAADAPPTEQEMLEMLELMKTLDPKRYEALMEQLQAAQQQGGEALHSLPLCSRRAAAPVAASATGVVLARWQSSSRLCQGQPPRSWALADSKPSRTYVQR
jgi:hypothetical protein